MASVEHSPESLCGADDGNGCGGVFPRKVEHGLCARCAMLSTLTEGTDEWNKYQVCFEAVIDIAALPADFNCV
jgi:hypothetical protein